MPDVQLTNAPLMPCAGEALTGMISQGGEQWVSRVGGSVWNVARALAVLGQSTAFAGATPPPPGATQRWFELLQGDAT